MKYGALSAPVGTLDLSSIADGEDLVLTWLEHGGPKVIAPVGRAGFGSRLVQRSVTGQLGGTIDRSEEHTSELQSLMRISYAVFCLKKTKHRTRQSIYPSYRLWDHRTTATT